jgi:hypothetical protein
VGRELRRTARNHPWKLTVDEVAKAVDKLSYKKALGTDEMPDMILHDMLKDTEEGTANLRWLTARMEALLNSDYWPQYLFSARPILLSKDGKTSTTKKNTRILSVIPAITKLLERITLNRMAPVLYGVDGIIPQDQQGFRPNAGTTD